MKIAIIGIGDEVLTGDTVNTNAAWLASAALDLGLRVAWHAVVPDDEPAIVHRIREAAESVEVVLLTGGLGPTRDDLTRAALAVAVEEDLVEDEAVLRWLEKRFARTGRELSAANRAQAQRPASAETLDNPLGSAPGLVVRRGEASIIALPGVPDEMRTMWTDHVVPRLRERLAAQPEATATAVVRTASLAESRAGRLLADLMERGCTPSLGLYPGQMQVDARIRATGPRAEVEDAVERTAAEVERRLAPFVYARGSASLTEVVRDRLAERRLTVSTAESCTAGGLGHLITEAPGTSAIYLGGFVTYGNEQKRELLGVPSTTLETHGAVSAPTAEAMARGARDRIGADLALSITGIAGPDGGSDAKPVGTVFIGLAGPEDDDLVVRRFRFPGDRRLVRIRTARTALAMLRFRIMGDGTVPELLAEVSDG